MVHLLNFFPSTIIILAITSTFLAIHTTNGSSNTVAITHSSYSNHNNNYDHSSKNNGVIKSERPPDEEYVTSFYKRVREKHRANFGRQLEAHARLTQRQLEEEESGLSLRSRHHHHHRGDDGSSSVGGGEKIIKIILLQNMQNKTVLAERPKQPHGKKESGIRMV